MHSRLAPNGAVREVTTSRDHDARGSMGHGISELLPFAIGVASVSRSSPSS